MLSTVRDSYGFLIPSQSQVRARPGYTELVRAERVAGDWAAALAVLPEMRAARVAPTARTYTALIRACRGTRRRKEIVRYETMYTNTSWESRTQL